MIAFDVIIPARNEAATIGPVVAAAVRAGCTRRVLVIDDGSQDATGRIAKANGAHVLRNPKNLGKGRAMLLALGFTDTSYVCFLDADLRGFTSRHLEQLWCSLAHDRLAMVCGLRDYGPIQNAFQQTAFAETITGERICARWLLEAVPRDYWNGYAIEAAINGYAKKLGAKVGKQVMSGVSIVNKTEKEGFWSGLKSHGRMFQQVGTAVEKMKRL